MISITDEKLISVAEAREMLPGTRPGSKVGIATLTRWISSGRLESIKIGGRRFTSVEALQRFANRDKFVATANASTPPSTRKSEAIVRRVTSRLDRFNTAA